MTYLGYPGTTGLPAIDYRITAAGMDILGEVEGNEKLLALPHSYFCYLPLNDLSEVSTLPMQASGVVTFGSFNRLSKINATVIAAWSKILHAVPRSRLQLMAIGLGEPATRDDLQQHFAAHDVAPEQIVLHQPRDEPGYYAAHHKIDIMLDPFPFNGGTTTLHALWMGVPVVTLAGQLPVGRMGLNILTTAGLGDLVADSTDRYIALAAELAADPARLADLRRNMRQRLTNSPMMKAQDFTRSLEALYREAWKRWCEYTPS
jgi:predicted O-linked N-acetylglucosamine transferase (SPINDLY family)